MSSQGQILTKAQEFSGCTKILPNDEVPIWHVLSSHENAIIHPDPFFFGVLWPGKASYSAPLRSAIAKIKKSVC